MASQLNEPPRIFFGTSPEEEIIDAGDAPDVTEALAQESDAEQFCRCKGSFKSLTGYFVACESDAACPNGGWLHPECTTDLHHLTKEQIDTIATWYCEDCRAQNLDEGNLADEEGINLDGISIDDEEDGIEDSGSKQEPTIN